MWMLLRVGIIQWTLSFFCSTTGRIFAQASHTQAVSKSPFLIIVDGGSTGSRLHVFEFVTSSSSCSSLENEFQQSQSCQRLQPTPGSSAYIDCIRRGTARTRIPLSNFVEDYSRVADHLFPAFIKAAALIPSMYHNLTRVWIQATAGMRLVDEATQTRLYDALYEQLRAADSSVFPFGAVLKRDEIATLSGEREGFFAAVAANFLDGSIRVDLTLRDAKKRPIVGALDMGGSSTQIVFLPAFDQQSIADSPSTLNSSSTVPIVPETPDIGYFSSAAIHKSSLEMDLNFVFDTSNMACSWDHDTAPDQQLQTDGFFINSYLSYGVDQFRRRLWLSWIEQHQQHVREASSDTMTSTKRNTIEIGEMNVCDSKIIENPCVFEGYAIEFEGYTLIGTGQAESCLHLVQQFLLRDASPSQEDNQQPNVGGVRHPAVHGKFYAMSNYFYTLDNVRKFVTDLHDHDAAAAAFASAWPTPTLTELERVLPLFCNNAWQLVLDLHQSTPHAYTQSHILPHRCLEAVYMVTLLRHGFGFHPHSRDITFALHVQDSEVEWTLGMALILHNQPDSVSVLSQTEEMVHPIDDLKVYNDETYQRGDEDLVFSGTTEEQEERQNSTTDHLATAKNHTNTIFSTRSILRRVAQCIETMSTLDYMHTI